MIPFEIPVVRGYTTLAKTNRPDVKMPLCERSRFIRPHQDTPSSIIRHYISRYSTTQFHWIYPSAEDKKKKRKQVGEEKRERKFWPLIGLNRIAVALLELGDWKLGSRQTARREDTFVAISLSISIVFFLLPLLFPSPLLFYRISIIESKVIPKDRLEKQATRIGETDYRSKIY